MTKRPLGRTAAIAQPYITCCYAADLLSQVKYGVGCGRGGVLYNRCYYTGFHGYGTRSRCLWR